MLESRQQEDPCLQCGGSGQSCTRVRNSFTVRDLPTGTPHFYSSLYYTRKLPILSLRFRKALRGTSEMSSSFSQCLLFIPGYNQMFIIPVGATTISIRETVATRNYLGECLSFRKTERHFTAAVCLTVLRTHHDFNLYARPAIKNLRGEYYLNGHWVIEFSRATPVAGTMLYYQRGAEGDNIPETIIGRGPTTEPLVVEVRCSWICL